MWGDWEKSFWFLSNGKGIDYRKKIKAFQVWKRYVVLLRLNLSSLVYSSSSSSTHNHLWNHHRNHPFLAPQSDCLPPPLTTSSIILVKLVGKPTPTSISISTFFPPTTIIETLPSLAQQLSSGNHSSSHIIIFSLP